MKNIDVINNIISNRKGIDEKIVKSINKYYWKNGVKKNLSNLTSNALFIRGLGTIVASRYNVRKMISKTIIKIRGVKNNERLKETTKEIYLEELYRRLRLLLKSRNELAKLYKKDGSNNRILEADTNSTKE